MAKYFIIARKKDNSYTTIDINGGNSLEEIDIYTNSFATKKDLLKDMAKNGLDISERLDLFIASPSPRDKNIKIRRVFWNNKYSPEVVANARASLKKQPINTSDVYKKAASLGSRFKSLNDSDYFDMYKAFDKVLKAGGAELSPHDKSKWVENSYANYRDTLVACLLFEGLNLSDPDNIKRVLGNYSRLGEEREAIFEDLKSTLKGGILGQNSLALGGESGKELTISNRNNLFVHIKSVFPEHIKNDMHYAESVPQKNPSIKDSEEPIIENTSVDKVVPLNLGLIQEMRYKPSEKERICLEIKWFLTNSEYFKSEYINDKNGRVSLNYDALPFDLNSEDKKKLNSYMASKPLLRLVKEYHRYNELEQSFTNYDDQYECANDIKNILQKSSGQCLSKLNKFAILYKDCYDKSKRKVETDNGRSK